MFTNGVNRILYLKVDDVYQPIGCLTSDSFSESSEMLGTTTRDNPNGWKTSIPTTQSFSCSFDGLITKDAVVTGLTTYYDLKTLKRNREVLDFRLGTDEFFSAIIVSLSDSANIDEFTSFSGELQGVGVPRNIYDANTFIGGVSSVINTPQLLADKLSIDESNIFNFIIKGDDIQCHIDIEYSTNQNSFKFDSNIGEYNLTYYKDLDGKLIELGKQTFHRQQSFVTFEAPNLKVIKDQAFYDTTISGDLYFPNLTNIDSVIYSIGRFSIL